MWQSRMPMKHLKAQLCDCGGDVAIDSRTPPTKLLGCFPEVGSIREAGGVQANGAPGLHVATPRWPERLLFLMPSFTGSKQEGHGKVSDRFGRFCQGSPKPWTSLPTVTKSGAKLQNITRFMMRKLRVRSNEKVYFGDASDPSERREGANHIPGLPEAESDNKLRRRKLLIRELVLVRSAAGQRH